MEHASVAAFARFALQLLSVGAPAELVSGAARAMADEIRHACDCFGIARRYSGEDVGPGALSMDGVLQESDLGALVANTVREGCVGETLAAIEAAEVLQHCGDASVRAVLARIAADEIRHAELAWKFVAWALTAGPSELRSRVRETFDRELEVELAAPPVIGASDLDLSRHGLLSRALRQALRARVLREVVGPCSRALLVQQDGSQPSRAARNVATL